MMKPYSVLIAIVLLSFSIDGFSCTSLIVGKNASADGSTMISYSADSHVLYGELYHWPAAEYKSGAMLNITEWDTGKPLGKIPQVKKTYAVTGNMNEFQLSIAESTWGGRPELEDTTALMDYGSLIYITLQRAKTAREAIMVMGDLVKKYGYRSTGESFSIADPNEVWFMDMIGKGKNNKGAVWVAVRIPDDCISGHANQARIRTFPLDDKENCIYSPDVISFAREMGYFNGLNKDFNFTDAYAINDFEALRFSEARVWSFFNKFHSGMNKYLPYIQGQSKEPLPLYIKPDKKVTTQEIKNAMRDHFEGTPFDMTKDAGAGPFESPYRFRPLTFKVDSLTYLNERAIATQQTGFTFVAQMRNWLPNEIGGVLWFGVDDANTCVYVPIYCSITEVPECYRHGNGDLLNFSWSSAFWIHNWVANMAYGRYNYMIKDIRPLQEQIEKEFNDRQAAIDKAATEIYASDRQAAIRFLNDYSGQQAQTTTEKWKKLGEYLLIKHLDGNIKKEKNGKFQDNGYGVPETPDFPGYSNKYYRSIVNDAGNRLKVPM